MAGDDLDLDGGSSGGADASGAQPAKGSGGGLDWGVVAGLVISFVGLMIGVILEGGSPISYTPLPPSMGGPGPSAFIIIVAGTVGATLVGVGLDLFKTLPGSFMRALKYHPLDRVGAITTLVGFAERARREGLLVLEDDLRGVEDQFLKKGVQLVVDGTDPELVKEILQTEVDTLAEENENRASVWTLMGGFCPTIGVIGTVMGLVIVLGNLADPAALGGAIAVAFIATLYGVGFANLIFLPIGNKLTKISQDEVAGRELMIEGILAIQSGDNPRIVEEKLVAFLDNKNKLAFLESRAKPDEFDLAA